MEVAIIGLPQSGKSTVFNALTRGKAETGGSGGSLGQMRVGVVKVPDSRLDALVEMYHPRKVVPAEIKFWDLPGPESLDRSQSIDGRHRNILQGADAYLLVIRAFPDPAVPHPMESVGPGRDLRTMLGELALADLEVLERAVERMAGAINKSKPAERPTVERNLGALQKASDGIERGIPLRLQELTGSEASFLSSYQFLSSKPVIVVFNRDESQPEISIGQLGFNAEETVDLQEVSLCGKLEAELALMSEEEEAEWRKDLDLGRTAGSKVIQLSYQSLGLISFLTVGDDEVRAWSVSAGLSAQEAAGTIHTDLSRGFIRAEVIRYDELVRCGSIAQGRKEGLLRSEGKIYRVEDGDIINFLVNV
jgi:GTP-binding protein YchF